MFDAHKYTTMIEKSQEKTALLLIKIKYIHILCIQSSSSGLRGAMGDPCGILLTGKKGCVKMGGIVQSRLSIGCKSFTGRIERQNYDHIKRSRGIGKNKGTGK